MADPMTVPGRIVATAAAMDLLRRLGVVHGPLMMHQSGGCCDGSAPMCYPAGEFIVGDRDVLVGLLDLRLGVGEVPSSVPDGDDAVPVWISGTQFAAWQHTQLVLDVVPGRGSGFSLETPEGVRFLSRARAFTPEENGALAEVEPVTGQSWEEGRRPEPPAEPQVVAEAVDACPVPGGPRADQS
ncbi:MULTISPECIES: DUF779 domain-containing protein [Rhodococcus]|uniref:DUF779 domain-containing protein n=2 Tax=Nocardiaceae TaxID=85025 RepID=UPI000BC8667E|nr:MULTISPECIES: DUF779 domain-containing protein [Rhodococcus]MBP1162681.1 uncharacterized protein (DUF779 family) [Rhodococcus sp. PvR099]MCZ4555363.1 DUF779 domain-containing protein [Rhodococcus maanshanensis]PTR44046.1 hypothetical protein C8K38_105125 [Rhodococcus sp. OK611]SNX90348.1 hypothetical protein SAMN05447004_105125 [Rhodococcus sp. OK270]